MTTTQYLAALKQLGLSPHGIKTREALGDYSARQLARFAAGGPIPKTLELLLGCLIRDRQVTELR